MASSIKTSFSIKGAVTQVKHNQGGELHVIVTSEDGSVLDLVQLIEVGQAKVVGTEIDRSGEDLALEEIPFQVGDAVSGSISISASGPSVSAAPAAETAAETTA